MIKNSCVFEIANSMLRSNSRLFLIYKKLSKTTKRVYLKQLQHLSIHSIKFTKCCVQKKTGYWLCADGGHNIIPKIIGHGI